MKNGEDLIPGQDTVWWLGHVKTLFNPLPYCLDCSYYQCYD